MSACVHHGGAGTTAAALRAGRPSVIIPFFGDQPFWARRVERLRAGVTLNSRRHLTGELLAAPVRQVTGNSGMRANAEKLGSSIRAEDGVGSAISFLHSRGLLKAGQSTVTERA
jgi:UDP:flavonoid glycosyltransferase YjiC (YdhE family)